MKKIIYALYLFSGISALIFEIIWMRFFSLIFGVTTYAVTIVLGSFMCGLAFGSIVWGRISKKNLNPLRIYSGLEFGIGFFGLTFPFLINWIKNFYVYLFKSLNMNFDNFMFLQMFICFSILIIPTFLMGGTLPVIYRYFELSMENPGNEAGFLYAYNTIGAVIGSILAGFFLIEKIGVNNTNNLAGAINIFVALIALFRACEEINWTNYRAGFLAEFKAHPQVHSRIKLFSKDATQKSGKKTSENVQGISSQALISHRVKTISKKSNDEIDNTVSAKEKNPGLWFIIFAISGLCGIGYEVVWTRILVLIINSTTYSFSLILIVFLLGIAVGSASGAAFISRFKKGEILLGFSEIFIGLYTLALICIIGKFADWFFFLNNVYNLFGNSWILFILAQFVLLFIILFPITFALGITFPAVVSLLTQKDSLNIGKIYGLNTFGGVLGALITGLFLIQIIGIKYTILCLVIVNIIIGIIALFRYKPVSYKSIGSIVLIFIVFLVPVYSEDITFRELITRGNVNIIFHHEDAGSIIEVYKYPQSGDRILVTDRHQREGGTNPVYVFNQRQQGYLPLLLHPSPKKILGLGLGTGISFSVVENFDVEKADVAEISNGVIKALEYFEPENRYIKNSKKITIHKADARNFILLNKDKYDIIMSDLFVPYQAGVGNLYSYEHFKECKNKLNTGGMMWQWIPIGQISMEDLEVVINTFHSVFPNTTLWLTPQSIALAGTLTPLIIDFSRMKSFINSPLINKDLKKIGLDTPYKFLSLFQWDERLLKNFINTKKINMDNYPYIEFNSPKYFYAYLTPQYFIENMNKILPVEEDIFSRLVNVLPEEKEEVLKKLEIEIKTKKYLLKAQVFNASGKEEKVLDEYIKLYNLNPENNDAKLFLENYYTQAGWQSYKSGKYEHARKYYKKALEYNPDSKKIHYYIDVLGNY